MPQTAGAKSVVGPSKSETGAISSLTGDVTAAGPGSAAATLVDTPNVAAIIAAAVTYALTPTAYNLFENGVVPNSPGAAAANTAAINAAILAVPEGSQLWVPVDYGLAAGAMTSVYLSGAIELRKIVELVGEDPSGVQFICASGYSDYQMLRNWTASDFSTPNTVTVSYSTASKVITYVSGGNVPAAGDVGQYVTGYGIGSVTYTTVASVVPGVSWTLNRLPNHSPSGNTKITIGDINGPGFYAPNVPSLNPEYFRLRDLMFNLNGASNVTCVALNNVQERTQVENLIMVSNNGGVGNVPMAIFEVVGNAVIDKPVVYGQGWANAGIYIDGSNGGMKPSGSVSLVVKNVTTAPSTASGPDGTDCEASPIHAECFVDLQMEEGIHCEGQPPNSPFPAWAATTLYPASQPIIVKGALYTTNGGTSGGGTPSFPSQWEPSTAYGSTGVYVVVASGALAAEVTTAGTSGATPPVWPTTAGGTVTDGTVTWTMVAFTITDNGMTWTQGGQLLAAAQAWIASTYQPVGVTVTSSTELGYTYRYSVAGVTGSGAPTFPTTIGGSVTDGAATLVCTGVPQNAVVWAANTVYPWRTRVITASGIFFATNPGESGSSTPTWASYATMGATVVDNQITWQNISPTGYTTGIVELLDVTQSRIAPYANAGPFLLTRPFIKNIYTGTFFGNGGNPPQSPLVVGASLAGSGFPASWVGNIIEDNVPPWNIPFAYPTVNPQFIDWYDGARLEYRQGHAGTKEILYQTTPVNTAVLLAPYAYNDLLGASVDDMASCQTSPVALGSAAVLYLVRIPLPNPISITSVLTNLGTIAGAALTNSFVVVFQSNGAVVGQTADQSATWAASGGLGIKTVALVGGPFAVSPLAANDFIWAAYYVGTAAGTLPAFQKGGTSSGASGVNIGTAAARTRVGSIAQANTATIANITPASIAQAPNLYLIGIK